MAESPKISPEQPSTEERLENGIRHQPERYLAERDADGRLVSVADTDTGRVWFRIDGGWGWVKRSAKSA